MSDSYRRRNPARRTRTMTHVYPGFTVVHDLTISHPTAKPAEPESTGAAEPLPTDNEDMPIRAEDAAVVMTSLAVWLLLVAVIMALWR